MIKKSSNVYFKKTKKKQEKQHVSEIDEFLKINKIVKVFQKIMTSMKSVKIKSFAKKFRDETLTTLIVKNVRSIISLTTNKFVENFREIITTNFCFDSNELKTRC